MNTRRRKLLFLQPDDLQLYEHDLLSPETYNLGCYLQPDADDEDDLLPLTNLADRIQVYRRFSSMRYVFTSGQA